MARRQKQKKMLYKKHLNKAVKWTNRTIKWWTDITEGLDKLSSSAVKITVCLTVFGLVLSPDATVSALIKYGPMLRSTFSA